MRPIRRPAPKIRRRGRVPGRHLHLCRHQAAGARPAQLLGPAPAPCSAWSAARDPAKSTVTRLLQGINREYSGFIKIDGADLREINLRHLRSSFGVVLQENFLFRGSIRDNILAGRPGLTLEDAIRAARLAGRRGIHRADAQRL